MNHQLQKNKQRITGILSAFFATMREIFSDKGVFLLLIAAPIVYGFFYPWPYNNQRVLDVPTAIVDYDNTALSRQLIRYADASPKISIQMLYSEDEAKQAFWRGEIEGYMVIPKDLKYKVTRGAPVSVAITGNGNYPLLAQAALSGFAESAGTLSAGIEIRKLMATGVTADQAHISSQPINLLMEHKFNVSEGYKGYIVPAVGILILQQTILMAIAMFVGTLCERKKAFVQVGIWLGRILAFAIIALAVILFYFGWLYYWQDFSATGVLWGSLLFAVEYAMTLSILGCLLGLIFGQRERGMQVMVFTSLPFYFLSGISFPKEGMPDLAVMLSYLVPSTPAMHASLLLNHMGSTLGDALPYLLNLGGLMLLFFACLLYINKKNRTQHIEIKA